MSTTEALEPPVLRLPQEIIDLIVDYLSDDKPSLTTTSLISRSWIAPTQHHLFSTYNLTMGEMIAEIVNRLGQLCQSGADINLMDQVGQLQNASTIRIRKFLDEAGPRHLWPLVRRSEVGNIIDHSIQSDLGWKLDHPITGALLSSALDKFVNLRSLTVKHMELNNLERMETQPTYSSVVSDTLSRELKELSIMDTYLSPLSFTRILERFTTIDELLMLQVVHRDSDLDISDPSPTLPTIKRITINKPSVDLRILNAIPDSSIKGSLQSFSVMFPSRSDPRQWIAGVRRILEASAGTLQSLRLDVSNLDLREGDIGYVKEWQNLSLDKCTSLETVQLSLNFQDSLYVIIPGEYDSLGQCTAIATIISLLPPSVHECTIGLTITRAMAESGYYVTVTLMAMQLATEIAILDDALAKTDPLNLKKVLVRLESPASVESKYPVAHEMREETKEKYATQFPKTAASGRLAFW